MSLLYRRALAALKGLHVGDGQPQRAGGMLDWSLTLASWLIDRRSGPHPAHRIAGSADLSEFPSPPQELTSEFWTAGAGVVVGLLRRPQDHNGMIDDAVTLVVPLRDAAVESRAPAPLPPFSRPSSTDGIWRRRCPAKPLRRQARRDVWQGEGAIGCSSA